MEKKKSKLNSYATAVSITYSLKRFIPVNCKMTITF